MSITKHNAPDCIFESQDPQEGRLPEGGNFREKCPPEFKPNLSWADIDDQVMAVFVRSMANSMVFWKLSQRYYRRTENNVGMKFAEGAFSGIRNQILSHLDYMSPPIRRYMGKVIRERIAELGKDPLFR